MVRWLLAGLIAMLATIPTSAFAQQFPTKVITIIVPFAAGGPTDTVTRLVAQAMSKSLNQQVIVENVGGAGGTIGAARAAKATPDGHTLLLFHIGQATSVVLDAPKGTPRAVIDKLAAALQQALQDPLVKTRFAELGTEPVAQDRARPEALRAHLKAEVEKWGPIIKKAGVYAD